MKYIKDFRAFSWLLVTLLSLIVGQWLLSRAVQGAPAGPPPWTAVVVLGLGALAIWMGRSPTATAPEIEPSPNPENERSIYALGLAKFAAMERQWRPIALVIAVALILLVLWRVPRLGQIDNYSIVFWAWLLAVVLLLAAVYEPLPERDWRGWWARNRWLILAVVGLIVAAFLLRIIRVSTIPYTLGGDEASQGLEALRFINGELTNPFTTGWLGVPTLSFFYNSLSIRLLGPTTFALRLPWVLIGTATVLTTFLLVRQLVGIKLALVTAALLGVYHYHIHFSRLGSNQIADPFFLSLSLYFLYRALDGRKRIDWALTGVVCGMAFYFYAGARLTPVVLTAVVAYLFLISPRRLWQDHHRGLLVALISFFLVAAPMIQYALRFPNDFNARMNEVGIIQSGWLENEVFARGESMLAILFDQFRRAALAFNYYPDRTVWYGLNEPLLDPFFGGLFLLGLLFGTLQLLRPRDGSRVAPMVAWWWGGMILGGMLTESPPSSQRLITLAVPVCFFIAYAAWEILKLADRAFGQVPEKVILTITVFLFAFISLTTYFVDFSPKRLYGGRNAEFATQISPRLNELKTDNRIYFVGAPWMYWGFATLPYLVPGAVANDIIEPITDPPLPFFIPEGQGAVFILIPPRITELGYLQAAYPQGMAEDVFSPIDGRHMGTLYRVPPLMP